MDLERLERLSMRAPSEEWIADRNSYLGGTDIAAILDSHPYKTARTVYMEKMGLINPPELNQAMVHGQNLELYVMQLYRIDTGRRVRKSRLYKDRKYSFLGVNPDYEIIGEPGLLECKTAGTWSGQEFGAESDAVPNHQLLQCMWQMAITKRKFVDLAVLIGGQDYRCYTISRDDGLIERMKTAAINYWHNYILSKNPPPLSGDRPDCELVNNMYPISDSDSEFMYASEDLEALCEELRQAKITNDASSKEVKRLENEVKTCMEDVGELRYKNGKITWKSNKNGSRVFRTYFKEAEIWQKITEK